MKDRSLLFVPAHRADFVEKAPTRGADIIILDLEDGVPADQKEPARRSVASHHRHLRANGVAAVMVRINPLDNGGREDVAELADLDLAAVMLPKVEKAEDVLRLHHLLTGGETYTPAACPILPLLETPAGVLVAGEVARAGSGRLFGLAFGSEDFAASLNRAPSPRLLAGPAQHVVLAAASVSIAAYGLPGSIGLVADERSFRRSARLAFDLGFAGATCVSPRQVPILNQAFLPSATEQAWARSVLDRASMQAGAFLLDGAMVDPPVVVRARRILDCAGDSL